MSTSEKFYNRFAFLYPLVDIFLKPQKKKFYQIINAHPCGQLLEVGIGNGSSLSYYTTHTITGIDTSVGMLAKAQRNATSDINLCHMNGEQLAFPNQLFDYVVLAHVIAVVNDPEKLLTEVHRVLKPGGKVFILNHFTPANWLGSFDKVVESLSQRIHIRSMFPLTNLGSLTRFSLVSQRPVGLFSYFKILVYEKNP